MNLPTQNGTPKSTIETLFETWQKAERDALTASPDLPEEELMRLSSAAYDLADAIEASPSQNATDWALKFCAYTSYGAHGMPSHHDAPTLRFEADILRKGGTLPATPAQAQPDRRIA